MEEIHNYGIGFILQLQNVFKNYESEMLFLSRLGDPRNAFLIYFPVAYHINCRLGLTLLWSFIFSEWLNLILKWILRGERPYWWVHESSKWHNVAVKQFELTCETGPGSPSGHSMVTAAVFFIIFMNVAKHIQEHNLVRRYSFCNKLQTLACWLIFVFLLILVSFSRVFIATHFPHQVIFGTLCGVAVAHCLQKSRLARETRLSYCLVLSFGLFSSTLLLYHLLSLAVYDPSVTLRKAQKWCSNPSYIHLDTTPFYALVRDLGAALGVGLSYYLINIISKNILYFKSILLESSNNPVVRTIQMSSIMLRCTNGFASLTVLRLVESVSIPQSNWIIFYIAGYVRNATDVLVVMVIIPLLAQFVCLLAGRSNPKHN